jgi:hypothetical protein
MHLSVNPPSMGRAKPINQPPGPPNFVGGYLPPGCGDNSGIPCPPAGTGFLGLSPDTQGPQDDARAGTLSRVNGNGGPWPTATAIPVYPASSSQDPFLCVANFVGISPTALALAGAFGVYLWASGTYRDVFRGIVEGLRG